MWTGGFINTQLVKASFTGSESQQRQGAGHSHQSSRFSGYHMQDAVPRTATRSVCLCESVYLCGYPPVLIAQYSTEEETEAHRPQTADLISGMSRQK